MKIVRDDGRELLLGSSDGAMIATALDEHAKNTRERAKAHWDCDRARLNLAASVMECIAKFVMGF